MTIEQIEAKGKREQIRFEAAKEIRAILNAARIDYGPEDYDAEGIEEEILSLVTEDE